MQNEPLVAATMSVSTLVQGITVPGQKVATRESVTLEVPPPAPGQPMDKSIPNGTMNITVTDPEMIGKLKLGESYKVLIVPLDAEG